MRSNWPDCWSAGWLPMTWSHACINADRASSTGRSLSCRKHGPDPYGGNSPKELVVRVVRFRVKVPGFRTEEVVLATTLLDEKAYPDAALIELYRLRWQIEGNFRDIKTTLGLDVLRTPKMIEREILMQVLLAHNLVRAVMRDAAHAYDAPLGRISFKAALTGMRQWVPLLLDASACECERRYFELLAVLASDLLPLRPNRSEPRAVKRRPKVYQLLNKPRRLMRVSKSQRQK